MNLSAPGYRFVRGALAGASLLVSAVSSSACINTADRHPPHDSPPTFAAKMKEFIRALGKGQQGANIGDISAGAASQRDFSEEARRYQASLAFIREYETTGAKQADFASTINYSAALMHAGRPERAVEVLVALEAKQPGAYETATNLGTAYELVGKLEDAATWIGKGIERNPASHSGTEWLHLAILRAKIQLRDDPAWFTTHGVLEGEGHRTPAEIVRAIEIQLRERLQFVKPKDAAVCDLFYQAALRLEGDQARDRRAHYLRESLRFGDWRKPDVEKQLKS